MTTKLEEIVAFLSSLSLAQETHSPLQGKRQWSSNTRSRNGEHHVEGVEREEHKDHHPKKSQKCDFSQVWCFVHYYCYCTFSRYKVILSVISIGRWKLISSEMTTICMVNRRLEKWWGVSWGSYWLLFSKVWCWSSIGMGCKDGSRYFREGRGTWQLKIIQFSQRKGVAAVPSADP